MLIVLVIATVAQLDSVRLQPQIQELRRAYITECDSDRRAPLANPDIGVTDTVAAFARRSRQVEAMADEPRFRKAFPYQDDVLSLPVADLDTAAQWYSEHFGMTEVERLDKPVPTVILERDGTRIGFAINGGDPAQDGAAVLVSNIRGMKDELEAKGAQIGNWRVDEREGQKFQVFFVVAPDGLCYYFHEPIEGGGVALV